MTARSSAAGYERDKETERQRGTDRWKESFALMILGHKREALLSETNGEKIARMKKWKQKEC